MKKTAIERFFDENDKVDLLKSITEDFKEEYFLFIETDTNDIVFKEEYKKFFCDINCNIHFNPC